MWFQQNFQRTVNVFFGQCRQEPLHIVTGRTDKVARRCCIFPHRLLIGPLARMNSRCGTGIAIDKSVPPCVWYCLLVKFTRFWRLFLDKDSLPGFLCSFLVATVKTEIVESSNDRLQDSCPVTWQPLRPGPC